MAGHERHFSIGLLFYPLFFLLWNLVFNLIDSGFESLFNPRNVVIGVFVYSVGSILPDVDVQSSLIHRIVRNLLVIPSSAGLIYFLLSKYLLINCNFSESILLIMKTILMYLAIIGGFIAGWLFKVSMKHRGFLHSPLSSIIYGGIVFVVLVVLNFGIYDSLFLSIIAASGYLIHILTDYISPLFRRGK